MRLRTAFIAAIVAALVASATAMATPASAGEHCRHQFGSAQQVTDAGGAVVEEWAVADMQKSTATLPGYTPRGQLWEASATVRAVAGARTPIIPNLSAATKGGQRYPVLWQIATAQGLPATTLAESQSSSGKVYFDVVGLEPIAVVYDNGTGQTLMWCCIAGMSMPMSMPMPMENCPMCAAMSQPCPGCGDGM